MSLTPTEKQALAQRITRGIQVVCSSLAQLYLTSPDPNAAPDDDETGIISSLRAYGTNKWKFTSIEGALLLTRNREGFCHFRIYDLSEYKLRFQYELYENLDYMRLNDQCHAFEMESCVCGFSFSDKAVATKFFDRVQSNIVRTAASRQPIAQSQKNRQDGRGAPPPVPKKTRNPNYQPHAQPLQKVDKRQGSYAQPQAVGGNLFLENGLLDPNSIPHEWRKILRRAGIKKKDLRNPTMQDVIRETLEEYNISIEAPPLDMDDQEIRQYYTPAQLAEYEQYKSEMEAYEADLRRYEEEMAEYKKREEQATKLDMLVQQQQGGAQEDLSGEARLRQSVMLFQGKEIRDVLPVAQEVDDLVMPRMSVARPLIPALPVIPDKKEDREEKKVAKATKMVESRNSKLLFKPNFLSDIKKHDFRLKHVSVALPDLKTVKEDDKNGILNTLMEKIKQQRAAVGGGDDEDDDDFDDDDEFDP